MTVPLSVVWRRAFFSSTPCWFAPLYTKTVKIIWWASYLQPTLKSFPHTLLYLLLGLPELPKPWAEYIKAVKSVFWLYIESVSNSLDLLWTSGCELLKALTGMYIQKFEHMKQSRGSLRSCKRFFFHSQTHKSINVYVSVETHSVTTPYTCPKVHTRTGL